jgi:hypothetical protein
MVLLILDRDVVEISFWLCSKGGLFLLSVDSVTLVDIDRVYVSSRLVVTEMGIPRIEARKDIRSQRQAYRRKILGSSRDGRSVPNISRNWKVISPRN